MKKFFDLFLAHPKLALAAVSGLALLGVRALRSVPVDVFPDISVPRVVIQTEAGGLTAEEVEQRISLPIESAMNGIPGVSAIRSSSSGGLSFVWVDFDWNADVRRARFDVFERLARVRESLPPEADPELAPVVSVTGEIMILAISAPSNSVPMLELREMAEFDLRNRLLAVPGIGEVVAMGGYLPEYRIETDPRLLAPYCVSLNDVIEAAASSRTYASAGYLPHVSGEEIPLRQIARADTIEALKKVPVVPGRPLRLEDVADVKLCGEPRRGSASFNGRDAVVLSVQKTPGGNTPALTKALDAVLDAYAAEVKPRGVEIHKTAYRQDDFISMSVDGGKDVLGDAVAIVVIVLGATLLSVKTLAIVLFTIPVSVLLGILCFPFLGIGVNVMTLGGFAVAAGDIVDAAIIFTEAIWRRLGENSALPAELRKDRKTVITEAAKSVLPGVLFSTAIVVLVFIPLLMLTGLEGQFFRPLALAYLAVFSMSFFAAVAAVPAFCFVLWKDKTKKTSGKQHGDSPAIALMKSVYRPIVKLVLSFPRLTILLAVLLCVFAFTKAASFGSTFLPAFHEGSFNVSLSLPPGSSLDETERLAESCVPAIMAIDGVLDVTRRTGRAERDQHAEPVSSSEYVVRLDQKADANRIRNEIRSLLGSIPGASHLVGYPIAHRISAVLSGTEAEIAVNLYGEDVEKLRAAAADAKKILSAEKGVADVRANREVTVPSFRIEYDVSLLAEAGLSLKNAGEQVSAAFSGIETGEVRNGLSRRAVTVRIAGADRTTPDALKSFLLTGKDGRLVRLDEVARIIPEMASNLLLREGGRRKALISCNPSADANTGDLLESLRTRLAPVAEKYGCSIEFGGSCTARESAARSLAFLGAALLAAIALLVFAALRDVRATVLALVNIPLGLVGGVAAVAIADPVLSVSSLVGFITVTGFTLRNGLLLLNSYRDRTENGESLADAIEGGSTERMAPILMTSLTTVIGLVPIVLAGNKPGGELLAPLAIVQFGGILGATLLNLVVMPAAAKLFLRPAPAAMPSICAFAAVAILCVSGCRSYEPAPVDWKAEAANWTSNRPSVKLASPADAAVVARIGNAELNAMRLKCRHAKAIAADTGWWDDPSFDLDLNRIIQSSENPFLGGASVSFSIPLSGAPAFDAKAADLNADADALAVIAAENDVAADARSAFLNLKAALIKEKAIRGFIESPRVKALENTMKSLASSGEIESAEIAAMERRLHARRHLLDETLAEIDSAENSLRKLLGLAPSAKIEIAADDTIAVPGHDELGSLAAMPSLESFANHPKVKESMARLEGGEAALQAEIRRQYPDLKFGPGYSREEGLDRVGVVAGIDIPLWNRNRKAVSEATAERDSIRAAAILAWRNAVTDAAMARRNIDRLLKHELPETQDEDAAIRLYESGEMDAASLLGFLEDSLDAKLAETEFSRDVAIAVEELKRTM